ncbi:peptidoglycan DD-metalloendopeptidase family protein [Thermoanaerobacter sp. CM-CNRG TB177]|uniref:murein hydrolase activator EnvC family protein n=1 Tax=Thermoanaerobacter sp. CM-CNRG TB177 TaxID=2800659 RepID=UPI001BDEED42|nr:M23 family metallopeptidase [Thermoanaerobacter sp. CM-CNRG TB177]MBT1280300.1 peptidoglycan DD-metalloendopeptidase family protein [Thermoanaerobacter sp. CM-CNRG TB177]
MRGYRLKWLFFGAMFFFTTLFTSYPKADQLQDAKNKLNQIQKTITETKKKKEEVINQKNDIAAQIADLDKKLNVTQQELANVQKRLADITEKLNKTREELEVAKQKENTQLKTMKERIRAMYISGELGYLEVLLGAKDFGDFITRLDVVKCIVDYDSNLFESYKQQRKLVEQKEKELAQMQIEAQNYKNQIISRQRELQLAMASREGLMRDLERQQKLYEQQEDELLKQSKQLEKVIQQLQAKSKIKYSGGKLLWPVPSSSVITSPFGTRYHPILKQYRTHTGIDIAAQTGASILAAADGQVIFAGYYGGYGYAVIIDHGDGISTLYGHNSALLVKEGDTVKRGQVIAKAGSTGLSTGPHLHFEVRKNGVPVNPMDWLK